MLLNYRKDIDGLRAIAVLLVVFFHVGFPISGGFIGVDIFFVISGFLIASLIQKQILRDKFSFKGFYLHRMRRILPALIAVIIATFVAGWFLLMPEEFNFFVSSIIYSLIGFSNLFFFKKGNDYFAADTDTIQLLHTWSLGVEEQFYFIAPIFLLALFKFFYKTKWFNIILVSLLVLGLGLSQYLAVSDKSYAYYLLPARFFELLTGVILALNFAKLPELKTKLAANILAIVALALMLLPAFFISKEDIFPGFYAFAVCLGACLVIYIGKLKEKTFLTKFLSIKPVVFIGLISYSLYLWHWPVISIINSIGFELNYTEKSLTVAALILVSYLSWKFIEQPFRNKFKFGFAITFIFLLLIPAIGAQLLKDASRKNHGFQEYRFYGDVDQLVKTSQVNIGKLKQYCHSWYDLSNNDNCTIGNKSKPVTVLMFGDSHANAAAPMLEEILKNAGLKSKLISEDSTLYLTGLTGKTAYSEVDDDKVQKMFNLIEKAIVENKYEYVIFSGVFYYNIEQYGESKFVEMFNNTIKLIEKSGAIAVIIKDVYEVPREKVYCSIYKKMLNLNSDCNSKLIDLKQEYIQVDTVLNKIEQQNSKAIFIDPKKILCDDKTCYTSVGNTVLYRDGGHLTLAGSKYIGQQYLKKYENPFIKK